MNSDKRRNPILGYKTRTQFFLKYWQKWFERFPHLLEILEKMDDVKRTKGFTIFVDERTKTNGKKRFLSLFTKSFNVTISEKTFMRVFWGDERKDWEWNLNRWEASPVLADEAERLTKKLGRIVEPAPKSIFIAIGQERIAEIEAKKEKQDILEDYGVEIPEKEKLSKEEEEALIIPYEELPEVSQWMDYYGKRSGKAYRLFQRDFYSWQIEEKGLSSEEARPINWKWEEYYEFVMLRAKGSPTTAFKVNTGLRAILRFIWMNPVFGTDEELNEIVITAQQLHDLKVIQFNTTHPNNAFPNPKKRELKAQEWGVERWKYYDIDELQAIIKQLYTLKDGATATEIAAYELLFKMLFLSGQRIGSRRWLTDDKLRKRVLNFNGMFNLRWEFIENLDDPRARTVVKLYAKSAKSEEPIKYKEEGAWIAAEGITNISTSWNYEITEGIEQQIKEYRKIRTKELGFDPYEKGDWFFPFGYEEATDLFREILKSLGYTIERFWHAFRKSFVNFWRAQINPDTKQPYTLAEINQLGVGWRDPSIPTIFYIQRAETAAKASKTLEKYGL